MTARNGGGITYIDYLKSFGGQYIDTGIYGSDDLEFTIKFSSRQKASANDSASASFIGARVNYTSRQFQLSTYQDGTLTINGSTVGLNISERNYDYVVSLSNGVVSVNGVAAGNINTSSFTTPTTIKLFGMSEGESEGTVAEMGYFKIYYVTFTSKSTGDTIADFRPCIYNGEYGMWETVSGAFFPNSGSGNFNADSIVTKRYITTPNGAYVDLPPNITSYTVGDVEIVFSPDAGAPAEWNVFFGGGFGDRSNGLSWWFNENSRYLGGSMGQLQEDNLWHEPATGERHTLFWDYSAASLYVDGNLVTNNGSAAIGGNIRLSIFTRFNTFGVQYFHGYIGGVKIWDRSGNLIMDLLPAIDVTSTIGLYDSINDDLYVSQFYNLYFTLSDNL